MSEIWLTQKYGVRLGKDTLEEQAQYTLRTMVGVSEESYSHCIAFLIYGTGQGIGNSPVVWCFLSSILFDCHASKAHGAAFESPEKKSSIQTRHDRIR